MASHLAEMPPDVLPDLLRERLNEGERGLLERAARDEAPMAAPADCINAIKRSRVQRDLAEVQEEIDRLQDAAGLDDQTLRTMWEQKKTLLAQFEALKFT